MLRGGKLLRKRVSFTGYLGSAQPLTGSSGYVLLPTQHVPSRKVASHKQLKIAKWSHRSVAKNTKSLVTNTAAGLFVIHPAEESVRESWILPLSKSFFLSGVACCPFLSGSELTLSPLARILFRRKHQWTKQEYGTSHVGHWLCQHCPSPRGALSRACTNRREKPHTLSWDGRHLPRGNNPYTNTRQLQWFWPEAWCCLKTWLSFDLRLLTHLQDLPGARSGVAPGAAPCSCRAVGTERFLLGAASRQQLLMERTRCRAQDGLDMPLGFGLASSGKQHAQSVLSWLQLSSFPLTSAWTGVIVKAMCVLASYSQDFEAERSLVKAIQSLSVLNRMPTAVPVPLAFLRCRQRNLVSLEQPFPYRLPWSVQLCSPLACS